MKKSNKREPHKIPYEIWSNSHLSIAKYYGGCNLNGKEYRLDFDSCKPNENGKYFPDLVEVIY